MMIKAVSDILRMSRSHLEVLGPRGMLNLLRSVRNGAPIPMRVPRSPAGHECLLRAGTTDPRVFRQVFIRKEYAYEHNAEPAFIIDAGANIGLSAIYFAEHFPDAHIVALEPEKDNFDLLVKNTAPYPNVEPVRKALWKSDETVDLVDPGNGEWGYETREDSGNGATRVPGIGVDTLMEELGAARIGLLKIDIEGAEYDVLETAERWLHRVDTLILEVHESLRPGVSELVRGKVTGFSECAVNGENQIFKR